MKRSQGLALLFCVLMLIPSIPSGQPLFTTVEPSLPQPEERASDSKALSSLTTQLEDQDYSMSIASVSPYDNSYDPMFFVRTEGGSYVDLTAQQLNGYGPTTRRAIWGAGIRTKFGVVAFYTNDQDTTWGHGQFITYPVFANGSLPAFNRPIMGTYLRLWMRAGSTWYQNYLTSQPLFQANGFDPRITMTAQNTTSYLELGYNGILTIQGFDFDIYIGMRLYHTEHNQIHIKTNITSLDRAWDGVGLEYTIAQSSFYDGSDYQIMYGTVENADEVRTYRLNQFRDMTQVIPNSANKTRILTRNNITVHEFDWDDLRAVGFDTALFQIENMQLPNGQMDYVLRVGMYAITPIPQGYTIEIDPSVTITSDATRAFPYSVCRDSNNIPYVLGLVGTTLYVFKGDGTTPSSFSNETVGDGNVYSEYRGLAYMNIGSYSGTEYIFVIRVDDDRDLVLDRSTIGAFSFDSGDTIEIEGTLISVSSSTGIGADYGESRLVVHVGQGLAGSNRKAGIYHSSDGGGTWTGEILTWDHAPDGNYPYAGGVAWDGSYWHLSISDSSSHLFTKRWSSGSGLEYWDGDSWESSTEADDGLDAGVFQYIRNAVMHGKATSNIIVFGHPGQYTYRNNMAYSLDGGQSWTAVPSMGDQNYCGYPSFTIKTEAGEVDDVIVFASNYDSNQNDVNDNTYDFSGDSWGGWSLIWDSGDTADTIQDFAGLLLQQDGWVDYAFQHYDDSESTYVLNFTILETGSAGGDETAPSFAYDGTSTTNNSNIQYNVDNALANWSVTEAGGADYYWIFTNATGVNVTQTSGSYSDGDYLSGTYTNTNITNIGNVFYIQVYANDTSGNMGSAIAYFTVLEEVPVLTYDVASTANNSNVEFGTEILSIFDLADEDPDQFAIYGNETGVNVTKSSGAYSTTDSKNYNQTITNSTLIGMTIFVQIIAGDDGNYQSSLIVYFNIIETISPTWVYYGVTNNSQVLIGTPILFNWTASDPNNPDDAYIFSNSTGVNATKLSQKFTDGEVLSWEYSNTNISNDGVTIFGQLKLDDTQNNLNASIIFITPYAQAPDLTYTGDTNESSVEWETDGAFTTSWTVVINGIADTYIFFSNVTGSNETLSTGALTTSVSDSYDPVVGDIGKVVFIELFANNTNGYSIKQLVFFTVTNTASPTVSITSPTNTSFTGNATITLSSSNGDLDTYWFSLYYGNGTAIETNTTWTTSVERELDADTYYVIAYCNDTAGLEDDETVWFTITEEAVGGGGGSSGIGAITDRLMDPILPDLDYPILAVLVIAGIGLATQYSGPEPNAPQKRTLRQVFIILFVGLLLFTLAILFDVFGVLRNALGVRPQLPSMPQSWQPYFDRLMEPAVPLIGLPLLGIFLFAGMGLSTQYMAPEPKTAQKRRLKRIFVIILIVLMVYAILILFQIPELLSNATSSARQTIAVINLAWLAPLVDRLMAPAFPFLPFDYPLVAILLFSGIGFYTQYIGQPPSSSGKRSLKQGFVIVFGGLLIYSLFMLFNIFSVLGELWNVVVKIYT